MIASSGCSATIRSDGDRSSRARYGGAGYIAGEAPDGLLTVNTAPARREIEVRHRLTRTLIATTFSKSDGTYRVSDLDPNGEFDVFACDYMGTYSDVIVSRVRPTT